MRRVLAVVAVFAAAFAAGALARGTTAAPRVPSHGDSAGPSQPHDVEALRREVDALEQEVADLRQRPAAPAVGEAERLLAWLAVDDEAERDARSALLMLDLGQSQEKRAALIDLWEKETDAARLASIEALLSDLVFRLDPAFQEALERLLVAGATGPKALFALRHVDLEKPPDPKVVEVIRKYGEDADPVVRRTAVKALDDVHEPDVAKWKERLARGDADPAVRAAAFRGLDFDDERKSCLDVGAHLLQRETDIRVRQDALDKLGKDLAMSVTGLGVGLAPDDQSRLWKVLCHAAEKDTDPEVRANSVGLVAMMWRGRALPALEGRLPHETDPQVKENIEVIIQILKEGHTGLMEFVGEAQKRIRHFQKPSRSFEEEE